MSRLSVHDTPIFGLHVIERHPLGDERGFLERLFCHEELDGLLRGKSVRQINRTLTRTVGTVRGLHFQHSPYAEIKIVSCLRGKVWDVAVDLRKGSPTFLQYHCQVLSGDSPESFLIPEGFAHGFQTLTPDCEMLYLHTADYSSDAEGALNALDPQLSIAWPQTVTERSARDSNHPMLNTDFKGLDVL